MNIFKGLEAITQENCPLAPMTTFGVGGPAEYFLRPRTEDELQDVLRRAEDAGLAVRAIGRGSNLLVKDEGVKGAVVQLDPEAFGKISIEEDLLRAGAAASLQDVVRTAAEAGLSGVECLVGIPGSGGGGVRMNAGGAVGDLGPTVERVKVIDVHGNAFWRERDDLAFGYRSSNISARFILEAELRLVPDDKKAILDRTKTIWIAKRNSQPLNRASAGCVFRNPRGMSAGLLIDQAGLKGTTVGGAMISRKHANYIVVKDKTHVTAADVLGLIELIQKTVKERADVYLEPEIQIWP